VDSISSSKSSRSDTGSSSIEQAHHVAQDSFTNTVCLSKSRGHYIELWMDFNHKRATFSRYCPRVLTCSKGGRHSNEMNQQRNIRLHWKPLVFLVMFGVSAVLCGAQAISYRWLGINYDMWCICYHCRQANVTRGTVTTPTPTPESTESETTTGTDAETESSQAVFFIMGVLGKCL